MQSLARNEKEKRILEIFESSMGGRGNVWDEDGAKGEDELN